MKKYLLSLVAFLLISSLGFAQTNHKSKAQQLEGQSEARNSEVQAVRKEAAPYSGDKTAKGNIQQLEGESEAQNSEVQAIRKEVAPYSGDKTAKGNIQQLEGQSEAQNSEVQAVRKEVAPYSGDKSAKGSIQQLEGESEAQNSEVQAVRKEVAPYSGDKSAKSKSQKMEDLQYDKLLNYSNAVDRQVVIKPEDLKMKNAPKLDLNLEKPKFKLVENSGQIQPMKNGEKELGNGVKSATTSKKMIHKGKGTIKPVSAEYTQKVKALEAQFLANSGFNSLADLKKGNVELYKEFIKAKHALK